MRIDHIQQKTEQRKFVRCTTTRQFSWKSIFWMGRRLVKCANRAAGPRATGVVDRLNLNASNWPSIRTKPFNYTHTWFGRWQNDLCGMSKTRMQNEIPFWWRCVWCIHACNRLKRTECHLFSIFTCEHPNPCNLSNAYVCVRCSNLLNTFRSHGIKWSRRFSLYSIRWNALLIWFHDLEYFICIIEVFIAQYRSQQHSRVFDID